jgi:hypothetical protein
MAQIAQASIYIFVSLVEIVVVLRETPTMEKRMIMSSTPRQRAKRHRVYHRSMTTVVASVVHAIAGPKACHPISLVPKLVGIAVGAQSVVLSCRVPEMPWLTDIVLCSQKQQREF